MHRCMHRWVDPVGGKTTTPIGPYSCGRRALHKGVHAWDGNGAMALWTTDGELLMSVQQTVLVEPSVTVSLDVAEARPDWLDGIVGESGEGQA